MKVFVLTVCICFVSAAKATEVDTECPAMNENREKIINVAKPKNTKPKQVTAQ